MSNPPDEHQADSYRASVVFSAPGKIILCRLIPYTIPIIRDKGFTDRSEEVKINESTV
jgi:hypothetical protein